MTTFSNALTTWSLTADGDAFETWHSWLLPARMADGQPAMLKRRKPHSDETRTAAVLRYFGGNGAVRLLQAAGDVTLMERAIGTQSLMQMATSGQDEAAAHIIADVVAALHAPRQGPMPADLQPLAERMAPVLQSTEPRLASAVTTATRLLASAQAPIVLHGDLHHDNILHDTKRGWLAIDPNGVFGEATYSIANLLCNPWPHGRVVHDIDRMRRIAAIYAARLGFDRQRILAFALAHAGIAATWAVADGNDPSHWLGCVDVLTEVVANR